jgi:hypothetical protein
MDRNPFAAPAAPIADPVDRTEDPSLAVSIVCPQCRANIGIGEERCGGCRRAVTKDERRALERRWEAFDPAVAKAAKQTGWGRVSIGLAASLATLQVLVSWSLAGEALWPGGVALVLWALFAWSFRSSGPASAVALAVYVVSWLVQIVLMPTAAVGGVVLRFLIIGALGAGLGAERRMRRRRAALAASRANR